MLISKYFLPLLKEQPLEAKVTSHSLMLRSGMIRQHTAGIYIWLPLGLRVLKNIENIVRENMNRAGAIELLMPCIQSADLWVESGRFDNYGKEMLRFSDRHDSNLLFGPTNEEMITDIFRNNIQSYKNLPKNLYHIQWKFRDEIRPRFGLMRGREFYMKDAYTFDVDKDSAMVSYKNMYKSYMRTFREIGLSVIPVLADNGPIGGDLSHEFHIMANTGESTIYYDERFEKISKDENLTFEELQSLYAVAEEKYDPKTCPIKESSLKTSKGIEVGHIFYMGTKYSKSMNAVVSDRHNKQVLVEMSSYGIGISRLVAAFIEANHDDKGMIWNKIIAPFKVSIINLNIADSQCNDLSLKIYNILNDKKIDVLYDDSDERAGVKFATHDLIGSPYQVIIGPKKAALNMVELKYRIDGKIEELSLEEVINKLTEFLN